jgi:methyl-accepting chemotaxis protein
VKNESDRTIYQARASKLIMMGVWLSIPLAPLAGMFVGNNALPLGIASVIFALLGQVSLRLKPEIARIGAAQAAIGQAIVINAAFAGHRWQIDMHMLYFAVLAVTMILNDARATILATATIVVHHLAATVFMPSMVFPSASWQENLPRTLLHGAVVMMETVALAYAIISRNRLDEMAEKQSEQVADAMRQADIARSEAETSREEAETAQKHALEAQSRAEAALKTAEEESERAREADVMAREVAEHEARQREENAARQMQVVDALRHSLTKLRNNDLTAHIDETFAPEFQDLKDDFNEMVRGLCRAIEDVFVNAEVIETESTTLLAASTDLGKRTEGQAASLAEITASVSLLATAVDGAARDARTAKESVLKTRQEATGSAGLVNKAISAMNEIETASREIQKIVGVIDDISFQTNLLALNAGVEAARAGESGRGFAVVASEVRALSQRSAEAAQSIKTLITDSAAQIVQGADLVRQSGEANTSVMDAVSAIVGLVEKIAVSSDEQSVSLAEVNTALSDLDSVTQTNAAMFEETTAANTTLASGIENLINAVRIFVVEHPGALAGAVQQRRIA